MVGITFIIAKLFFLSRVVINRNEDRPGRLPHFTPFQSGIQFQPPLSIPPGISLSLSQDSLPYTPEPWIETHYIRSVVFRGVKKTVPLEVSGLKCCVRFVAALFAAGVYPLYYSNFA